MASRQRIKQSINAKDSAKAARVSAFMLRLDKFLQSNLEKILGDIDANTGGLEAARALGGLQSAMEAAGLTKELGALSAIYGDELTQLRESFRLSTNKNLVYNTVDVETLETLINFDIERFTTNINTYLGDVKSLVLQSVLAGSSPDIAALHDDLGSRLVSNMETELNTALSATAQAISLKKSEAVGITKYLYDGPSDDDVIRPFCQEHVGKIYTIDEIRALDNGQGLPVETYKGGYNCRHEWVPLSDELAAKIEDE